LTSNDIPTWQRTVAALALTAGLSGVVTAALAADRDDASTTTTPIKHAVIIFQENISFDHYFGTYPNAANPPGEPGFGARDDTPTVSGLSGGLLTNNPNKFQPFRLDRAEAFTCDEDHGYSDEQKADDSGLMDKFVQATSRAGVGCRPDGSTVMGYYDGNTVTALWNYAQHYAMNDNAFNTVFGPSTPGAINLISGQHTARPHSRAALL
jgi:phospholipase C